MGLAMQFNKICVVVDIYGKSSLDPDVKVQTAYGHDLAHWPLPLSKGN